MFVQPLSSINHPILSQKWMKHQEEGSTWKIRASDGKFGEISSKFGLSGVCATPHTQCAASSQCATPMLFNIVWFLPVRHASLVRRTSQTSSNFTQIVH